MRLTFSDDFSGPDLDTKRWVPHYLPQWTTPDRSSARYRLDGDGLRLLVEADQPAWRTEDGPMRVSNLQTGLFSGEVGSERGTHRHRAGLTVVTPQPTRASWTPTTGAVEVEMAASPDPTCMLAAWLVGLEESSPEDSGEVCIAELFGSRRGEHSSYANVGVKAHHDPRLTTDMEEVRLALDSAEPHTYRVEWDAAHVLFSVDGETVRTLDQGLAYPLQLMVDLFEFPESEERDPASYPKSALVRAVRGWS